MADFNGTSRNDVFIGDPWSDHAWGYGGSDRLYGNDASDALMGGAGRDFHYGGRGAGHLEGGLGPDVLFGGNGVTIGHDEFVYRSVAESPARAGKADLIRDWNCREDEVIFSLPLSGGLVYGEARTRAGGIESARAQAEHSWLRDEAVAFLYNPAKDIGFLLYDNNHNSSFEMGIILMGAGSGRDFSYDNLF